MVSPGLTLFSAVVEPGILVQPTSRRYSAGREGVIPDGSPRQRQDLTTPQEGPQKILGAVFVLLGILLWGIAAIVHLHPDALAYAGITAGGAAVVVGIILFATTL